MNFATNTVASGLALDPPAKISIGFLGIVPALGFAQALVFLCLLLFGSSVDAQYTLAATFVAGTLGIVTLWVFGLRAAFGSKALAVLLAGYGLRCLLGIAHYLWVMQPDYFQSPGDFEYLWDFHWMHESLVLVSNHWHNSSILEPLPESFFAQNKNAYLMIYNGLLYFLTGHHPLNISPWNSLHNTYTAALVGSLALHLGSTRRQALLALGIVAFQPFQVFTDIMARDTVGQTSMAVAVYLLVVSRSRPSLWIVLLPVAAFLGYCVRQPYAVAILAGAGLLRVLQVKKNLSQWLVVSMVALLLIVNTGVLGKVMTASLGRWEGQETKFVLRLLNLPLMLLRAIMGPFPWFQIFDRPAGYEFMVPDFLQVVVNLALLYLALPRLLSTFEARRTIDPAAVFGLLLYLMGSIAIGVHQAYVSAGMVFMVPVACRCVPTAWWRALGYSFAFFILANGIYFVLGLKGSSIVQSITGY